MVLERLHGGKCTATGLCVGFVAGLATITPASGYVQALPAMAIGCVGSLVGFGGILLRKKLAFDDALDVSSTTTKHEARVAFPSAELLR
jgi:Amt family ammonium transporter